MTATPEGIDRKLKGYIRRIVMCDDGFGLIAVVTGLRMRELVEVLRIVFYVLKVWLNRQLLKAISRVVVDSSAMNNREFMHGRY
jgi:hypothetical protein